MGILTWIIIGGLAGWVASLIMKTDTSMGPLANIVVGIIGAFIGGWIMSMFGGSDMMTFSFNGFLTALLGAIVLLGILRLVRR